MEDRLNAAHATTHPGAICNRADVGGKRRFKNVETDHLVLQIPQSSNQGLAQMPGASGNQYLHDDSRSLMINLRTAKGPLFRVEPLGVEFGASPGCPVSMSLSRSATS